MSEAPDPKPVDQHNEYQCPGCRAHVEYRIAADVYGCDSGRRCTQATPEQRIAFEKEIVRRLQAWYATNPEKP